MLAARLDVMACRTQALQDQLVAGLDKREVPSPGPVRFVSIVRHQVDLVAVWCL